MSLNQLIDTIEPEVFGVAEPVLGLVGEFESPAASEPTRLQAWTMRAIDLVGAVVLLVLLSPVLVVVSLAVALASRGPVIFRQERVGLGGRSFVILKFRTMVEGTDRAVRDDPFLRRLYEANDFKLRPDDPRITRVGRLLRRTSLDELPQLVNVVRGEMSLAGVRPLVARELELRPVGDQALYRAHRPGLTGLWQVEGRSGVGSADRFVLDRDHLRTWSVRSNLAILARTPVAVLRGVGAH